MQFIYGNVTQLKKKNDQTQFPVAKWFNLHQVAVTGKAAAVVPLRRGPHRLTRLLDREFASAAALQRIFTLVAQCTTSAVGRLEGSDSCFSEGI